MRYALRYKTSQQKKKIVEKLYARCGGSFADCNIHSRNLSQKWLVSDV